MRQLIGWGTVTAMVVVLASAALAENGVGMSPPDRRNPFVNGAPIVVPEIDMPIVVAPTNRIQSVDQLLAELGDCRGGGQLDLVMCLRGDMSSVDVRRMAACLGTNLIPDDPAPVRACFASLPR